MGWGEGRREKGEGRREKGRRERYQGRVFVHVHDFFEGLPENLRGKKGGERGMGGKGREKEMNFLFLVCVFVCVFGWGSGWYGISIFVNLYVFLLSFIRMNICKYYNIINIII